MRLGDFGRRLGLGGALGAPRGRAAGAGPGETIYAVGDVHGRYDLLKGLLEEVVADMAARPPGRQPILIFCGDYVDRGPQSAEVLEALVWLNRRPDLRVHFLKGNHEQALMQFLDRPVGADAWLRFGGAQTLLSYGVTPPVAGAAPQEWTLARDRLLQRMPSSHLRLLERLELMLVIGDYAFVHAGVRPGAALGDQDEEDLLWIRQDFLKDEGPFEKVIVHGHTWTDDQPRVLDHRIGVDTGAYATGVLTAVRLEGEEVTVLQARGRTGSAEGWT